ncbi:hypothetical protein G9E11_15240 [Arthrobacter sp. IA7]|uniref:PRC-barrel domain-containing protein n=1 Tax=Arthrobacter ipis TaxID=2716202 RepID=UPI0016861F84|nr:PRC-barrel domain-containing protein [Arthrobacter ipis]MBD1543566.1 hypothetical protein [Arthrobacter ipis]
MLKSADIDTLADAGAGVLAVDGRRIGQVGEVYVVDGLRVPLWLSVKTGLFGAINRFVPMQGARVEGGYLVVRYSKARVKEAPPAVEDGHFDPDEEDNLCRHYGVEVPRGPQAGGRKIKTAGT